MAALFPPQVRDWGLPREVPLTPWAARRVAREGSLHSFDQAALALNEDWGTRLDGKQIQRWAEAIGRTLISARDAEVRALWLSQDDRWPRYWNTRPAYSKAA